jgi:bifunctional polynucleotide phosphatase/kinase
MEPLGGARSCLYGVNLQLVHGPKVAAFDLDGTLIKSSFMSEEWAWWTSSVPAMLKEVHEAG